MRFAFASREGSMDDPRSLSSGLADLLSDALNGHLPLRNKFGDGDDRFDGLYLIFRDGGPEKFEHFRSHANVQIELQAALPRQTRTGEKWWTDVQANVHRIALRWWVEGEAMVLQATVFGSNRGRTQVRI